MEAARVVGAFEKIPCALKEAGRERHSSMTIAHAVVAFEKTHFGSSNMLYCRPPSYQTRLAGTYLPNSTQYQSMILFLAAFS